MTGSNHVCVRSQAEASALTTALVAVGASMASVAVVGLILLVRRRRADPRGENRLAETLAELDSRMAAMAAELKATIERAEDEGRRARAHADLGGTIDLDEVLSRTLEAAAALPGVDAAMLAIDDFEGKPLVATLGLSNEEAQRHALFGPPDGRRARSVTMTYRYPSEELQHDGGLIHSGVGVPLGDDVSPGMLTVFSRSEPRALGDEDVRRLEEIVLRAGPAIENARRFREARRMADLDALTNLHNRRYFHETLAREVARAHRYRRKLGLIVLDLDDFKEVNDRIGHLAGDSVLAEAAQRVRDVVRSADIACRVGGDEFAVILPESTLADADQLYRRVDKAVTSRPVADVGALRLSAGVAELRAGDDAASFFQRADDALYLAKEAGKGRAVGPVREADQRRGSGGTGRFPQRPFTA